MGCNWAVNLCAEMYIGVIFNEILNALQIVSTATVTYFLDIFSKHILYLLLENIFSVWTSVYIVVVLILFRLSLVVFVSVFITVRVL
jgi:hypothetical protein